MATDNRVFLELLQTHASLVSSNRVFELGQKVYATGITDALSDPIKIGDNATSYNSLKWQDFKLLKTIDLTAANVTYTLPEIVGGFQEVSIYWTNGGTYKMTLAVTAAETVGGLSAGTWLGEGTGHIKVISDGTNWQVSEYDDGNDGTDVMGLNGRNLETVLLATSAADAFTKLRAISSTGNFTGLRLGDYIDIPALSSGAISLTWN
nr:hypothetical protein [Candidatus Cloacimonadota bacterium]